MENNLDVLLVSEVKIKSYTSINTNLAPTDLVPHIFNAQNILLPNYIGATYYYALKERILNATLTADDTFLLDQYISPMLCNWGFYYATTFISYRAYNKNILKGTSENGEALTLDELKFLQSQIKNIAESYSNQMVNYLMTHSGNYPLYSAPSSLDGQLPSKSIAYTSNIVIPSNINTYGKRVGPGNDCGYNMPNTNN